MVSGASLQLVEAAFCSVWQSVLLHITPGLGHVLEGTSTLSASASHQAVTRSPEACACCNSCSLTAAQYCVCGVVRVDFEPYCLEVTVPIVEYAPSIQGCLLAFCRAADGARPRCVLTAFKLNACLLACCR